MEKIGKIIKNKRLELNMTQERMAELVGVSRQTISKWENDSICPDIDNVIRLSEIFNCKIDDIIKLEIKNDDIESKKLSNNSLKLMTDMVLISATIILFIAFGILLLLDSSSPNQTVIQIDAYGLFILLDFAFIISIITIMIRKFAKKNR